MPKEEAYSFLENLFHPVEIVVAHELHKNGMDHLHVYMKLPGQYRTSNANFADLTDSDGKVFHGNYQGCRSSKNVIKYCTKAEDYIANIDVGLLLNKVSSRKQHMADVISGKRTLEDLILSEPQYLFNYASLTKSLQIYRELSMPPPESLPFWLPNPWGRLLQVHPEKVKRRHYHIFSSGPNAGKTTWANSIIKQYGGVLISNREPYWNITPSTRFIIMDEYNTARFRYDEINAMADGTYCYRRFGSGVYQFNEGSRPLIILMGNVMLNEIYPHMFNLVDARYKCIDVSAYKF